MEKTRHPLDPQSNVPKFGGYDPNKYVLDKVSLTVLTNEDLTPGRPPCLTQNTIGKFLQPLTRELVEVPPRPAIDELPDAVIEQMVKRDKAFWVDKPGANAYTLHDAYYTYGMTTEMVKPVHQDVFPRSYQYDLDCVKYRRQHACDGLKQPEGQRTVGWLLAVSIYPHRHQSLLTKPVSAHCRNCLRLDVPGLTPFQLAWAKDAGQKRWRYYPDLTASLTSEEIRDLMAEVGRPFKNEACNWYYKNYPPVKYDCIMRKFAS